MDDAILHQWKPNLIPCRTEDVLQTLKRVCADGGRIEMLYARRQRSSFELRYLINHAQSSRFTFIICETTDTAPSAACHFPLLGWYEREITDLYGIRFEGHPEPYSLIRQERDSADSPAMESPDIQRLPFGPVRADVVEFRRVHVLLYG